MQFLDTNNSDFYIYTTTSKPNPKNGSQEFTLEWTAYKMVFEPVTQGTLNRGVSPAIPGTSALAQQRQTEHSGQN